MRKSLTREEILRRKSDIAELFTKNIDSGQIRCQVQSDGLKLLFLLKREEQKREQMVLISPAKSLGNAVQRNCAKRWQREFYRHSKQKFQTLAQDLAHKKWAREMPFVCHLSIVIYRNAANGTNFKAEQYRYEVLLDKLQRAVEATVQETVQATVQAT